MSKHRARVQFRRKIAARNADKTSGALMDIYRRATQSGSDAYLTVNQESDPDRIAKIQHQAQERRTRRNAKRLCQTSNEAVSGPHQPNGQPHSRSVPAKRIGKVRGLARRLLREIAERSNRGYASIDARS